MHRDILTPTALSLYKELDIVGLCLVLYDCEVCSSHAQRPLAGEHFEGNARTKTMVLLFFRCPAEVLLLIKHSRLESSESVNRQHTETPILFSRKVELFAQNGPE